MVKQEVYDKINNEMNALSTGVMPSVGESGGVSKTGGVFRKKKSKKTKAKKKTKGCGCK
jgi:hypothetical protein